MSGHSSDPWLVVFDWGGVVLRICRSWEEGCERAGLTPHAEDLLPESVAQRRELSHRYQLGEVSCEAFCEGLSRVTNDRMSPSDVARLHDAWLIEEYPGMADLIGQLNGLATVRTALLSNTNAGHWRRHLPHADGSAGDFPTVGTLDYRLGSHLLGEVKPEAAIYHSMQGTADVPPERILFFDDLAENVAMARELGWQSEQIDHTGDPATQITGHLRRLGIVPGQRE